MTVEWHRVDRLVAMGILMVEARVLDKHQFGLRPCGATLDAIASVMVVLHWLLVEWHRVDRLVAVGILMVEATVLNKHQFGLRPRGATCDACTLTSAW